MLKLQKRKGYWAKGWDKGIFFKKNKKKEKLHTGAGVLLTLTLLTWTIWRAPTNASKWRMGFNSTFKGLTNF